MKTGPTEKPAKCGLLSPIPRDRAVGQTGWWWMQPPGGEAPKPAHDSPSKADDSGVASTAEGSSCAFQRVKAACRPPTGV